MILDFGFNESNLYQIGLSMKFVTTLGNTESLTKKHLRSKSF